MFASYTSSNGASRAFIWRASHAGQLALILVLALALRAYAIGEQSLWTDELFSRFYPDLFGLKYLWTTGLLHENSPPLYYMLIGGWMRVFGTSEAALRAFSTLASLLTLPLVYLIGRELFDAQRGRLAALVFALSPFQIDFAQEARTYALLLIPIGMAMLATARLLRGDQRWQVLSLYGIGATLALYCHATAIFFIAACNIVVMAAFVVGAARAGLIGWIAVNAIVALLAIPELVALFVQGREGAGIDWIPPFRPAHVVRALSPIIVGTNTPTAFPGAELSLLLVVVLGWSLHSARPDRRSSLVLIAIPGTFACLVAAASLYNPIFIARVFCWFGIPLAVLLGHALVRPRFVLLATAVIACATGLGYLALQPQKEPWRELLHQLQPQLAQAELVALGPQTDATPFAYYAPSLTNLRIVDRGLHDSIETDDLPRRLGVDWITPPKLAQLIRDGRTIWLIFRTPDTNDVDSLLATVPPPEQQIQRSCGKVICITALAWSVNR